MEEKPNPLIIKIDGTELECFYGTEEQVNVEMQISRTTMEDIINSRMTFQRAFMSGAMKMKGDFRLLRALDQIFLFVE